MVRIENHINKVGQTKQIHRKKILFTILLGYNLYYLLITLMYIGIILYFVQGLKYLNGSFRVKILKEADIQNVTFILSFNFNLKNLKILLTEKDR